MHKQIDDLLRDFCRQMAKYTRPQNFRNSITKIDYFASNFLITDNGNLLSDRGRPKKSFDESSRESKR